MDCIASVVTHMESMAPDKNMNATDGVVVTVQKHAEEISGIAFFQQVCCGWISINLVSVLTL